MIPEKWRTWKMMRVMETRAKCGRSLAHVTEEDLKTTEGEGVDLLAQLSELVVVDLNLETKMYMHK
jgi:hypothetical protein